VTFVLDASAVLAFVYQEAGHDTVLPLLESAHISAANWSEVLQKIASRGGDPDRQGVRLRALGVEVEPLTADEAATAARLYPTTRTAGLSLGDRCCLALALKLTVPAVTAEKAWANADVPVELKLIR
jgi:ribonuclease VapC